MNEARCTYYKEFIDENSSDQSKLFRASKSLLNLQADKSLSPHTDASVLANEMGEYFIHKIVAIRSKLAGDTVSPAEKTVTKDRSPDEDMYSGPSSIIHLVALHRGVTSSDSRMVNVSLENGYFADDWKRAVVHPCSKNLVFN